MYDVVGSMGIPVVGIWVLGYERVVRSHPKIQPFSRQILEKKLFYIIRK